MSDIKAKGTAFGFVMDLEKGVARNWYQKSNDVRRWIDTDKPVEDVTTHRQDLITNEQEA